MNRMMTVFALVCSVLAATAHACLWDRDTLAAEARGLPGITEIITGRFDRFPPLFYEMRLERVPGLVESDPDDLELYDDAAVACDRLGRSDEAIGWMGQKLKVMDRLEDAGLGIGEHRYRYLANLGTFYVHRWLRSGANREDMADVERSRELIAAAIELNPDAHFGRERYQLLAIEWILNPPTGENMGQSILHMIPKYKEHWYGSHHHLLAEYGYADSIEGLSGLIVLGDAWRSIDVYYALAYALSDSDYQVLASLCMSKVLDLEFEGSSSLHPLIVTGSDRITPGMASIVNGYGEKLDMYYSNAKAEADSWVDARNQYALNRLKRGVHPDTDPEFWADWIEPSSAPDFPAMSVFTHNPALGVLLMLGGGVFASILALSGVVWVTKKAWSSVHS